MIIGSKLFFFKNLPSTNAEAANLLKTNDLPLILSGEMSSRLVYSEMLKQYLPNTDHDIAAELPPVPAGLSPALTYKYLNLFNLQACALSVESIKAE